MLVSLKETAKKLGINYKVFRKIVTHEAFTLDLPVIERKKYVSWEELQEYLKANETTTLKLSEAYKKNIINMHKKRGINNVTL